MSRTDLKRGRAPPNTYDVANASSNARRNRNPPNTRPAQVALLRLRDNMFSSARVAVDRVRRRERGSSIAARARRRRVHEGSLRGRQRLPRAASVRGARGARRLLPRGILSRHALATSTLTRARLASHSSTRGCPARSCWSPPSRASTAKSADREEGDAVAELLARRSRDARSARRSAPSPSASADDHPPPPRRPTARRDAVLATRSKSRPARRGARRDRRRTEGGSEGGCSRLPRLRGKLPMFPRRRKRKDARNASNARGRSTGCGTPRDDVLVRGEGVPDGRGVGGCGAGRPPARASPPPRTRPRLSPARACPATAST